MEDNNGAVAHRPQYSAFISYSHADTVVVRKLHAQLESYRLPKGLGRERLGKFFRDREDLSAAENLSDAVVDALTRSEVLVVVCSPEAKASRWVAQEIAYFREHCPGRPILAAIVRGEPVDAFPPALTEGGAEPLAADLRKQGDGWKLGFLKIVAGIARVPLDALIQRDSQRQVRRVIAVTGVTALVALAMVAMTMVALQARSEAESQRDAAEGLVEYMISDLRTDLEGVGRIDIMDGVDARALKYYQDQKNLKDFPAESLLRRGRVIEAMGQNEELRGNIQQALNNYRELYRTTGELLLREPGDPTRVLAHAWAENRLATFEASSAKPEAIKIRLDRALDLLIGIESWGKNRVDWWKAYALSSGNQCAIAVMAGQSDDMTRRHCENAIAGGRRWAELGGGHKADYGTVFNLVWLAKLNELRGNDVAARRTAADALRLSNRMISADPQNANFLSQRMEILAQLSTSDPALRKDRLREAIVLADRLIERDGDNASLKALRGQFVSKLRGAGK